MPQKMSTRNEEGSDELLLEGFPPSVKAEYAPHRVGLLSLRALSFNTIVSVLLMLNVINLGCIVFLSTRTSSDQHSPNIDSEKVFGKVGWHNVVLDRQEEFVKVKPDVVYHHGKQNASSPWAQIFPTAWIAVPSDVQVEGSVNLSRWGNEEENWKEDEKGVVVTLMHQLHCLFRPP